MQLSEHLEDAGDLAPDRLLGPPRVRAVQERDEEAETLFGEAVEIIGGSEHCRILLDVLPPYAEFLRAREREAEALELEARLAERVPAAA